MRCFFLLPLFSFVSSVAPFELVSRSNTSCCHSLCSKHPWSYVRLCHGWIPLRGCSFISEPNDRKQNLEVCLKSSFASQAEALSKFKALALQKIYHPEKPFKVLLVGDNGVGKTELVRTFSLAMSAATDTGVGSMANCVLMIDGSNHIAENNSPEEVLKDLKQTIFKHVSACPQGNLYSL